MRIAFVLFLLVLLATDAAVVVAGRASDEAVATAVVGSLAREDPLVLDDVKVHGAWLRALYDGRAGSPLWRDHVDAVTTVLGDATAEGLDPAAYHLDAIARHARDEEAEGAAVRELLISDALLQYAHDVRYGRIRPAHPTEEVAVDPAPDPIPLVLYVAAAPDVAAAMHDLAPRHRAYRALREALAAHRVALLEGERWPVVPDGPTLRPGAKDPTVPALRARLAASGELRENAHKGSAQTYDSAVVAAVKSFQATHGLTPDGVVGPRVRAALNVGLTQRIEQIQVNMERWRWMPEDLGDHRVIVNVAASRLRLVDDDAVHFDAPVIVGEPDKMTPMFSSTITRVIFNPSWTVPDKIARKELLPKVQRDRAYFSRQGIRLIGGWQPPSGGDDPDKVDWRGAHDAAGFRLRQAPGPQNPLGRVKFHIPNVFGVYLHDTNNRSLFRRDKRTLSHGCVRVGDALVFADDILADAPAWSAERRAKVLGDWKTTTLTLATPLPVHVMYETAWVDDRGEIHFLDDVYGRDRRQADALAGRPSAQLEAAKPRTAEP